MATADVEIPTIPSSPLFSPDIIAEMVSKIEPVSRPPPPAFALTHPQTLESYNIPATEWLTVHNKHWDGIATGALIFNSQNRVLLVQRAAHDSMPNRWETPGGAADDVDPNLFVACARELWEEAGLVATKVVRVVSEGEGKEPGSVFTNRSGTRLYCRFSFEMEVVSSDAVVLDPMEHQAFVWATAEEVEAQRIGDMEMPITNGQMLRIVLEGFRLRAEDAAKHSALEEP